MRRWVCAVLGPARHSLARVHKLLGNFGPSAAVVQAISISWRWSFLGAHHILGRCDWCQFVELLLQHIQDFRPRRNRSVAGTIWSNRAVSKLSRSGRNICRPVEVYFHDRAPRSEDTAKAAARQREKIWGLITSPRRFRRIAPRCKKSWGPDSVSTRWSRKVDLARFNSIVAAFFRSRARWSEFVTKAGLTS